jgi:hypothetical protein
LAEEVEISGLESSARDDVLNGRVPDVADREDNRGGRCSDSPEVVGEAEDGPVVADRAEVCVECVGEPSVVDKLRTDRNIGCGLEGRTDGLFAGCIRGEMPSRRRLRLTFGVE